MKFFTSRTWSTYGHVILPAMAGVLGLAALSAQWIENHRLRTELEKMELSFEYALRATYVRQVEQVEDLLCWRYKNNIKLITVSQSILAVDEKPGSR